MRRYSTAHLPADGSTLESFLLGQLPPGRILNVGSGAPINVDGHRVVNVDHSRLPRDRACLFVVADAERLPFRDEVFQGALLKDVIEHVEDPIAVLAEAARVVLVEGPVTVEVPRAIPRAVWADPTHRRGFTSGALVRALGMAGVRTAKPARIGGFRGAGRLGLIPRLESIMRVPVLGHWLGTNWIARGYVDRSLKSESLR